LGFVTARIRDEIFGIHFRSRAVALRQNTVVLSYSWFRHIEASALQFGVQALIVSGDNGLIDCG
jgi:hypothetical protein